MKRTISITIAIVIIFSLLMSFVYASVAPVIVSKFKDVKESDWFAEAIVEMNVLKIIDGFPDGRFNPQGEVTRAQFVKMLVQAMEYKKVDSVSFNDLKPFESSKPHWASVYIETALRNGVIIKDEIGENFFPDVPLKRSDMAMMMFRALKLTPSDGDNPYADMDKPNAYFIKLYEEYLIRGLPAGNKIVFQPERLTTRAQAAVIISRMVEYKANPEGFVAKAAMEERFKNGTQTEEDIALKRQIEIDKAKADPNYIMEPEIRILNTLEDFEGYGNKAKRTLELFGAYISLDNGEDYVKYASDTQMKIVCTDKDKDLLNTITKLTEPFISYDHVYEVRHDKFKRIIYGYDDEAKGNIVYRISRDEEKSVKGKFVAVLNYVKKGETVHLKFSFKRGNNTQEYKVNVPIN